MLTLTIQRTCDVKRGIEAAGGNAVSGTPLRFRAPGCFSECVAKTSSSQAKAAGRAKGPKALREQ